MRTTLAFAALAAVCFAFPASATHPAITGLTAAANAPSSYTGRCPGGTVDLVTQVRVDGRFEAGQHYFVQVTAQHAENPNLLPYPERTIDFTTPSMQTVHLTLPVMPNASGYSAWLVRAQGEVDVYGGLPDFHADMPLVSIPVTCQPDLRGVMQNYQAPVSPLPPLHRPALGGLVPLNAPHPKLLATWPHAGQTGVGIHASLQLTFSEPVEHGTGRISIYTSGGTLAQAIDTIDYHVRIEASSGTVDITLPFLLSPNTGYYVIMPEGAFVTIGGETTTAIDNPHIFYFTTGPN